MKKSNSRTFALTLALMMLATSCGGAGSGANETTSSQDSETTSSAPETSSEYVNPGVDYKGADFAIVPLVMPGANPMLKYNMSIEEENGDLINDAIAKTNRKVEETLNVNIKLSDVTYDTRQTSTPISTSIMAGDDEFKFAMVFTCAMPALLGQPDMLVDLASISTLDLERSWWNQNSVEEFNLFGKQYAVAGDICFNLKGAPICNFFNKQLIEDLKMEDPYELVDSGKWTLDKMLKMSTDAYADLNGNSKTDIADRYGMICEQSTASYFLYGSGVRYSTKNGDDVKLTINDPKTINVIEKFIPFINNDGPAMYLQKYEADYTSAFDELFLPTFADNRALFYANQLLVALQLRNMNADFGILPTPKYDEAQEQYYTASNTWWSDNVIVPVTNQSLEMTGHVLDAMGYYAQQYVTPAFIDETVIGKSVRDEQSAEIVQMLFDTQLFDICQIFDWGGLIGGVNGMPKANDTNFASMYASKESAAIAALEKTIEQLKG